MVWPGETAVGPETDCQLTMTPVVEEMLSTRLTCGVHTMIAPAATYSVGFTAVTVLTCVAAVTEAVALPANPAAESVIAPGASGVTAVDADPDASVSSAQRAA